MAFSLGFGDLMSALGDYLKSPEGPLGGTGQSIQALLNGQGLKGFLDPGPQGGMFTDPSLSYLLEQERKRQGGVPQDGILLPAVGGDNSQQNNPLLRQILNGIFNGGF